MNSVQLCAIMNMNTKYEVLRANLSTWFATKAYSKERRRMKHELAALLHLHPGSVARAMRTAQLTPRGAKERRGRRRCFVSHLEVYGLSMRGSTPPHGGDVHQDARKEWALGVERHGTHTGECHGHWVTEGTH